MVSLDSYERFWMVYNHLRSGLNDLEAQSQRETHGNTVFVSAIQKRNLEELRKRY